jgi:hypothetical protein
VADTTDACHAHSMLRSNDGVSQCTRGLSRFLSLIYLSINVIAYYQTILYENLGIVGDRNLLVTGIYNVVGPLFNFVFIVFFLDKVGRKKPLIFGTIAISVALICEAALGSQVANATGSRKNGISGAGVFFLFLVSCIFSVSFGPISWVYASEIMPLSIRGRGSAFATGVGNWLVGTIWSQVSPIALGKITYKFYFIFVAFNLCVTLPTIWFIFKVGHAEFNFLRGTG